MPTATYQSSLSTHGPDDGQCSGSVTDTPLGTEALGQIEHVRSLLGEALQPAAAKSEPDDEPLEDYMGRFMERLTGKKAETPEAATAGDGAAPSLRSPAPQPALPAQPREPVRPPECSNQMALLRELANQSARSAIAEHDHGSAIQRIRYLLVASIGCSLFSSSLAAMTMLTGLRHSLELAVVASLAAWCLAGGFFLWFRQLPPRGPANSDTAG